MSLSFSLSLWPCSITSISFRDSSQAQESPASKESNGIFSPFLFFFTVFCLNAGRSTRSSQAGAEDNRRGSPRLCSTGAHGHCVPAAPLAGGGTEQEGSSTPRAKETSWQDERCVLSLSLAANYFLMLLLNVCIREKWRRWEQRSRAGRLPAAAPCCCARWEHPQCC